MMIQYSVLVVELNLKKMPRYLTKISSTVGQPRCKEVLLFFAIYLCPLRRRSNKYIIIFILVTTKILSCRKASYRYAAHYQKQDAVKLLFFWEIYGFCVR